jgi:hypothetical protein
VVGSGIGDAEAAGKSMSITGFANTETGAAQQSIASVDEINFTFVPFLVSPGFHE